MKGIVWVNVATVPLVLTFVWFSGMSPLAKLSVTLWVLTAATFYSLLLMGERRR